VQTVIESEQLDVPEKIVSSLSPSCTVCHNHNQAIGTKCSYCYVRSHAKRRGLWGLAWFQQNFVFFSQALAARYWGLTVGIPVGDIETLVLWAKRNRKHPISEKTEQKIRSIIDAADRLAKKGK
jgi:hypothetical protein